MKSIVKYGWALLLVLLFSSCLKSGLEDLPAYDEANITKMRFEYRWTDESSDYDKMNVVLLDTEVEIDEEANSVSCKITVPASDDVFTDAIRDQVALSNIVGYADISTAAVIKPVGDAPRLGVMADFSKPNMQYEVSAADGSTKIWDLVVSDFVK